MIVFVSGEYPPDIGGLGDYTQRLRSALCQSGYESRVVSRRDVGRWDARSLVYLVRVAPRNGVVHIQYQAAAYDLLGDVCMLPAALHRLRPNVRIATTFHDTRVPYLFPRAGRLRSLVLQLLARMSDAVIAADGRDLARVAGSSARHWRVPIGSNVPCSPPQGYNRSRFRADLGLSDDDLAIVYFGLLNVSKGLDLLVSTFEQILAATPSARLLVLGGQVGASDPTDRDTAAAFTSRLADLAGRVIQPGWLPPMDLSAYLLAGDVALLPYVDGASARRGSLLACAEHGLPIVSTEPAAAEVAEYVCAGPAEPRALADAVSRTRADCGRLRALSRELAARTSWTRIAADHVAIYGTLLYSRS